MTYKTSIVKLDTWSNSGADWYHPFWSVGKLVGTFYVKKIDQKGCKIFHSKCCDILYTLVRLCNKMSNKVNW